MNKKLEHFALRAFNAPLLMCPSKADVMFSYLSSRVGASTLVLSDGASLNVDECKVKASAFVPSKVSGTYRIEDGVAIIPIEGSLVHKSAYVGAVSGVMGYDGIAAQLANANDNPTVKGVLLDVNSGGGEVSGCEALAVLISASAKPVWSISNELAASAAFWVASAASKVFLTNTAQVGSAGVVMAHADYSGQLAGEGVKVTLIHSGAAKVDGNPYEALPELVRADFQAQTDSLRLLFAGAVAANRKMSVDAVMATEARVYRGQAAVDIGFADKVASFDVVLSSFKSFLTSPQGRKQGVRMDQNQAPESIGQEAAIAAAHSAGLAAGASTERARISAILTAESAVGREAQANHLALRTNMSAEDALALMATFPVATPSAGAVDLLKAAAAGAGVSPSASSPEKVSESGVFAALFNAKKGA